MYTKSCSVHAVLQTEIKIRGEKSEVKMRVKGNDDKIAQFFTTVN